VNHGPEQLYRLVGVGLSNFEFEEDAEAVVSEQANPEGVEGVLLPILGDLLP
jgi:hypothetical protein